MQPEREKIYEYLNMLGLAIVFGVGVIVGFIIRSLI